MGKQIVKNANCLLITCFCASYSYCPSFFVVFGGPICATFVVPYLNFSTNLRSIRLNSIGFSIMRKCAVSGIV